MTQNQADAAVPGQWRPITRAKTYERVLDRIEEQILAGELAVGDRLPPERDLAAQLEVSRPAVREALRALQVQGVVQSAAGTGPDSGTTVVSAPDAALTRLLRLHTELGSFPVAEVLAVRVMLERASGRLAAEKATLADLERLAGLLARLADPALTTGSAAALDGEFHRAVAVAAGSPLVQALARALRASPGRPATFPDPSPAPDAGSTELDGLRADFRAVYDRIAARDGAGAANVLAGHLRRSCRALG
jgi:GntR family transcriptional regulator, transcriptional repressor for pyruvate dehydrogenase complex